MNVITQGIFTSYSDDGASTAPVILLLHGWGASAQNFGHLAGELAPTYRVLRLDLPGFGGSQVPPEPWHVEDYAKFVAAFLQKLDVKELSAVIGHSFGGRVIMKAASHNLFSAQRIVLLGSAGVKHSQTARNQTFKLFAKAGRAATSMPGLSRLRGRLRSKLYAAAGSQDYLAAGPLRQTFINTINEDLQADAASIRVPTLLIWGENDQDTPVADARLLHQLIPESQLKVIPAAGHYVHLDASKDVTAHIKAFLK